MPDGSPELDDDLEMDEGVSRATPEPIQDDEEEEPDEDEEGWSDEDEEQPDLEDEEDGESHESEEESPEELVGNLGYAAL